MNARTRESIICQMHERELALIDTKGREYTGGAERGNEIDTLANFKQVAARSGMHPLEVWHVYFLKHVDAISTYVVDAVAADREAREQRETSEPIVGRIDDARTYLGLLACLLEEAEPPRNVLTVKVKADTSEMMAELRKANNELRAWRDSQVDRMERARHELNRAAGSFRPVATNLGGE